MKKLIVSICAMLLFVAPGAVQGQGIAGKAAREFGEFLTRKLGKEAARHGDDAARLVSKHGDDAARLIGRHADDAARIVGRNGDDAAGLLTRSFASLGGEAGEAAAKAAGRLGARNGRRLVMMAESSELASIGRTPELMGVIQRYGDRPGRVLTRGASTCPAGSERSESCSVSAKRNGLRRITRSSS